VGLEIKSGLLSHAFKTWMFGEVGIFDFPDWRWRRSGDQKPVQDGWNHSRGTKSKFQQRLIVYDSTNLMVRTKIGGKQHASLAVECGSHWT
jgi:hypothetical protein